MALKRIRLGDYIEPFKEKCGVANLDPYEVSGVNRDKEFFEPSKQIGEDTSNYQNVPPRYFACNLMHVGRDKLLPVAYNHTNTIKHVSPAYSVFRIKENDVISELYFFLHLKSDERDRFFWFNTDASIRDGMTWDDLCNVELNVPDLLTQEKYVKVYLSMLENQKNYERGLDDLKLVCDGYIEDLRRKMPCEEISPHLRIRREQNVYLKFNDEDVLGVSQTKEIIETKSDTKGDDISKFTVIHPDDFVYNPRNGIAVGLNKKDAIISWNNTAFYISDNTIIPEYLMMWLSRKEWDRKVKVDSWGSSTEVYSFESLGSTQIPIPNKNIQQSIVNIYKCYQKRKEINEKLKQQIKDICSILIKGSIEEAREA